MLWQCQRAGEDVQRPKTIVKYAVIHASTKFRLSCVLRLAYDLRPGVDVKIQIGAWAKARVLVCSELHI